MLTNKIFGIGFHKTATSSLAAALLKLGYRVTGPNNPDNPNIATEVYALADRLVPKYDAFQDNPWPIIFRYLDEQYPGNKFILTIRPTDKWLKSVVGFFGGGTTPMREWIYGVGDPVGKEEVYRARYEQHNNEVLEYFKYRPDDLLVMDITAGDGWEKLCPFLELEAPNMPFPHINKVQDKDRPEAVVKTFLKRMRRRMGLSDE